MHLNLYLNTSGFIHKEKENGKCKKTKTVKRAKCVKKAKSAKKKQSSVTKSAEPEGTILCDRDSDASTGNDNDLGEMDNSMVVDSHSEKGVQVENYDTYVNFVSRKLGRFTLGRFTPMKRNTM